MPNNNDYPSSMRLSERLAVVEAEVKELQRQYDKIEKEVASIKRDVSELRTELNKGFSEVKQSVTEFSKEALNSLPPWAAHSLETRGAIIGVLGTLLGITISVIVLLLNKV